MSSPDRMLSILDLFRDDTTAVFQEDVMEHLECSRATAYRYLKSLTESGLLTPTAGGAYVLGSRIIELDRHLRQHDPLMRAARDVMRAIGDELHANLMLCSYYGDKVMCVDRYWPDTSIESSYARGRPFPMFRGATAKPILANLPPYQLRNLMLWHADEIRRAGLGENWDQFRFNLKRLRTDGVYVSHGEVDHGLLGIGAAIFSPEHKVVGSMVFITSETRTPPKRLALLQARIQSAAKQVSQNLHAPHTNAAAIGILPSRPRRLKSSASADAAAIARPSIARLKSGEEHALTSAEVDELLASKTPLAFYRKRAGLTQATLAKRIGVAQGFLSEIESGHKVGDVKTLRKIADTLKISLDYIIPPAPPTRTG